MKKIFITLFLISFVANFANAEETKQNKQLKETKQKELSEEDKLIAEFIKSNNESKELAKLRKTVDEIKDKLAIDKK